jgi:hypothetical protein
MGWPRNASGMHAAATKATAAHAAAVKAASTPTEATSTATASCIGFVRNDSCSEKNKGRETGEHVFEHRTSPDMRVREQAALVADGDPMLTYIKAWLPQPSAKRLLVVLRTSGLSRSACDSVAYARPPVIEYLSWLRVKNTTRSMSGPICTTWSRRVTCGSSPAHGCRGVSLLDWQFTHGWEDCVDHGVMPLRCCRLDTFR